LSEGLGGALGEGTAATDRTSNQRASQPAGAKSEPARATGGEGFIANNERNPRALLTARRWHADCTGRELMLVVGTLQAKRGGAGRGDGDMPRSKPPRRLFAERLTFELSWHRRLDARPARRRITKTASRAWRPAVGAQLERGVRRRGGRRHGRGGQSGNPRREPAGRNQERTGPAGAGRKLNANGGGGPARKAKPKRAEGPGASAARVHGGGGQLEAGSVRQAKRTDGPRPAKNRSDICWPSA
jgi:hypothetical protein